MTAQSDVSSASYNPTARRLHWWTVLFLAIQIPLGFAMVNIDGFPAPLYNFHKLFGLVILLLVLVRLAYRLINGAPADEPTLNVFEKIASHVTHWTLYGMLLLTPILGWLGISYYDAREVFGFTIPALVAKDQDFSERVFLWHKYAVIAIVLLAGLHIAAALMHYLVKKDGVLGRMIPSLRR
jgi:cytochrome b561